MIFAWLEKDATRKVEILRQGHEALVVEGDERFAVDARPLWGGCWSILIGCRSYEARVNRDGMTYTVEIQGRSFSFDLTDPDRPVPQLPRQPGPGAGEVTAPMPGRVARIAVRLGQQVSRGEAVVVVEAMKMENELTAARDGVVSEITCRQGDAVELGAVLVKIGAAGNGKTRGKSRRPSSPARKRSAQQGKGRTDG